MDIEKELNELAWFLEALDESGVKIVGSEKIMGYAKGLLGGQERKSWQEVVVEAAMVGRRHGIRFVKKHEEDLRLNAGLIRLLESSGFTAIEAQRVVLNIVDHGVKAYGNVC